MFGKGTGVHKKIETAANCFYLVTSMSLYAIGVSIEQKLIWKTFALIENACMLSIDV